MLVHILLYELLVYSINRFQCDIPDQPTLEIASLCIK